MPKKMYVVYCENDGTYWCGLNTWDNQLRKAKVFHSLKYANEVSARFKELKLRNVEIRMELIPEKPTNADRIRAMTDEELCSLMSNFNICDTRSNQECKFMFLADCQQCLLEWLQQPAEVDNGQSNDQK